MPGNKTSEIFNMLNFKASIIIDVTCFYPRASYFLHFKIYFILPHAHILIFIVKMGQYYATH